VALNAIQSFHQLGGYVSKHYYLTTAIYKPMLYHINNKLFL